MPASTKIIFDPCQGSLCVVVFAKFIFQSLRRLYSTPGRGRCVKDYLRLLTGVTVLVFAKFIFQPLRRLFLTHSGVRGVTFLYFSLYEDYLRPLAKVLFLKLTIKQSN